MSITNVSNLSLNTSLTSALQGEQSTLNQLATQLSSGKQYDNLTDYTPANAQNLISLQNSATQKQGYVNIIQGVSNNLSIYDTTFTDLESIATLSSALANASPSYSTQTAANVSTETSIFLKSVTADLNQEINSRYIFSGARYTTSPVQDLSMLNPASLTSTISTSPTLPSYDAQSLDLNVNNTANTITVAGNVSGTATIPQGATITINGTAHTFSPIPPADNTPTLVAGYLATQLVAAGVAGVTNTGAVINIPGGNTITAATTTTTNASAYVTDQADIDTNYNVNYGITSNDPSFQTLIAGLRYLQAAGNSTDATTYASNLAQASALLGQALPDLQGVHTSVANNINLMQQETTAQNTAIQNLTTQVNNIQSVDVTQVSTEITSLETVLQASYSATGSILKLSIVSYL